MKNSVVLGFVFGLLTACVSDKSAPSSTQEYPAGEIINDINNSDKSLDKPYVILVSIDGFRYDYAQRYGAENLLSFDAKATKMIPSFPSKTFPNHYTLVTGLYPGHNGLVSNEFYNPELNELYQISNRAVVENGAYYKGTPLWVLAHQNQMVSASMFWVGSEAKIQGVYPTYHFKYNGSVSYDKRVNQTIKWLQMPEKTRPHLITLYFSITDDVGHDFGPDSPEIELAVKSIDATIGTLLEKISALNLPVNVIVVSDHGMVEVRRDSVIYPEDFIPAGTTVSKSFPLMVYSDDSVFIDSMYTSLSTDTSMYHTYLKSDLPPRFHYRATDPRVGELVVMPKPNFTFGEHSSPKKEGSSTHGYDPADCPNMGAVFFASGPAFIHNSKIDSFENVDVYPLVSHILKIEYEADSIDGSISSLQKILK